MGTGDGKRDLIDGGKKMELQITSKKTELTPQLRRYIERKLGKLSRHLPNIIESKVEIAEEKTKSPQQHFIVRATVAGSRTWLHSEERGEDLFTAIDKIATTMTRQLEHYKGKLYEKGRGSSLARAEFSQETETVQPIRKVVKVKRFAIKPMSVAEAAEQMELLGHDFFLFFNADNEELNLLYRRKDGNYGLIEP
ncbi:MAG: ribosome hibernation-promoting factor, HPF/YfiA family, partial [Dehalococcoidales bacterium]